MEKLRHTCVAHRGEKNPATPKQLPNLVSKHGKIMSHTSRTLGGGKTCNTEATPQSRESIAMPAQLGNNR